MTSPWWFYTPNVSHIFRIARDGNLRAVLKALSLAFVKAGIAAKDRISILPDAKEAKDMPDQTMLKIDVVFQRFELVRKSAHLQPPSNAPSKIMQNGFLM